MSQMIYNATQQASVVTGGQLYKSLQDTSPLLFPAGAVTGFHAIEAHLWRVRSSFSITGQPIDKLNKLESYWDKKTRRFTLLIEGVSVARYSRKKNPKTFFQGDHFVFSLFLFQSTANGPSHFPLCRRRRS
ncbi:hypothetical protein ATANTOWER_017437 [Ataeniobius toweri]|uniref:Uncharacterized protein n=1 Tax=Ataeniobius toweri TaxID=208326 RepID=A0ABU7APP9_9TELE|nr:hypothetical protein [Ataeniobius toweri]